MRSFRVGLACALLTAACAKTPAEGWDYFAPARDGDRLSAEIARWRDSTRRMRTDAPYAPRPGTLGAEVAAFRERLRREQVSAVVAWLQALARERYARDPAGEEWPTLAQVLAAPADDCDGLELLGYHLLLELGLDRDRVFRAVLASETGRRRHMVTLWFESPGDPWVVDPTGAVTDRVVRMSEVTGWRPVRVFDEQREFAVRAR